MLTLFHYPLSVPSRYARLLLQEYHVAVNLVTEEEWQKRAEFRKINLAGTVPVLAESSGMPICGANIICEYLDETRGALRAKEPLFPQNPLERAEVRRLCCWFLTNFTQDTAAPLVHERLNKQNIPAARGGGAPNSAILRVARNNIKPHMEYLAWLIKTRRFISNPELSYADFAAAACISVLDYMGEIDWTLYPAVRDWYGRLKSRPSFRSLLTDRQRGLSPASHYADLDF